MIKEVEGDIMLTKAQAIAHGIAPHDHFDSGLALSLRKDYPAMVKDFRHFCHLENPKPGNAWMWGGVGGVRIINLMTQEPAAHQSGHPGKASLHNVNHALKSLVQIVEEEGITSLALPRLATGYGGLDWEEVKPLIYDRLSSLKIPVYIYSTYKAGEKAAE
jgi:O-acetyl-ADP-ribose deacetylase (regulator of RNase III)